MSPCKRGRWLFALLCVVSLSSIESLEVKLGYLYIQSGPSKSNGYSNSWVQESFSQFKLGLRDVNADASILPNVTLGLELADTGGVEARAMEGAMNLVSQGVAGIVGTGYSSEVPGAGVYCSFSKVPMVSPGSTLVGLSDKSRFPFVLRSIPSDAGLLKAIAVLVFEVGWRRAGLLFNKQSMDGALQVLMPALDASGIGYMLLLYDSPAGPDDAPILENLAKLDKTMALLKASGHRIIIADGLGRDVPGLNESATALGMGMQSLDYAWVVARNLWESALVPQMRQVLSARQFNPLRARQAWYKNRWTSVTKLWDESIDGGYNSSTGLPFFGADAKDLSTVWDTDYASKGDGLPDFWGMYVYDTVWLYAHAMDALMKEGKDIFDGTLLREQLLKTRFEGVTGEIFFDRSSQDRMQSVNFVLSSMGASEPHTLGQGTENLTEWNLAGPCSGCSSIDASSIPWPGGAVPSDGRALDPRTSWVAGPQLALPEGAAFAVVLNARDSFEKAPCRDPCAGPGNEDGCSECLNLFAALGAVNITFEDASTNRSLSAVTAPVPTQDVSSGEMAFAFVGGLLGAGVEDRSVRVAVAYRGVRLSELELHLSSDACRVGQAGSRGNCQACIPGRASAARGQAACNACAVGTYQATFGGSECSPCLAGHFTDALGSSDCQACSAGRFADLLGQRECIKCSDLDKATSGRPGQAEAWTTAALVATSPGRAEYAKVMGATDKAACSCTGGYYVDAVSGECVPCGEGLVCRLNDVKLAPGYAGGYASDGTVSVFSCKQDVVRCPGGEMETCAQGRLGSACSACEDGMTPADDPPGTCKDCGRSDLLVLIIVVLAAAVGVVILYVAFDRQRRATQNHGLLLSTLSIGITVTLIQQLGIIGMLTLKLPEPARSVVVFTKVFMFDLDVFRLTCIAKVSAFSSFLGEVAVILVLLAYLCVTHAVVVLTVYKGHFGRRLHILYCVGGSIMLVFLISIVTTLLAPFQCYLHPNGEWTVHAYPSTLCWNSSEHKSMVILAVLAFPLPLAFLGACIYITWALPQEIRRANIGFLERYHFLFCRFKPECHYYAVVLMLRSLCISLLTIIPKLAIQITFLQGILVSSLLVTIQQKPWRIGHLNTMESLYTAAMVSIVFLCALVANADEGDLQILAWVVGIFIVAALLSFPLAVGYGLHRRFMPRRKLYRHFLCHHKATAGAFARLLKYALTESLQSTRDVFLDSDNLYNLDLLFDIVANGTETLVVLGTKQIFQRPWCVGEMTKARLGAIDTKVVELPDYEPLQDTFIHKFASEVNMECLIENGMDITMVQDTLRWIRGLPPVVCDCSDPMLVADLVACFEGAPDTRATKSTRTPRLEASIGILVDSANFEGVASALVLCLLLAPALVQAQHLQPRMLKDRSDTPEGMFFLVVVCTNGCFMNHDFLWLLCGDERMDMLPVVAEEGFRFPTRDLLDGLSAGGAAALALGDDRDPEALSRVVTKLFKEIAVPFSPQMASDSALRLSARQVSARLPVRKAPPSRVPSFVGAVKSSRSISTGSTRGGIALDKPLASRQPVEGKKIVEDKDLRDI